MTENGKNFISALSRCSLKDFQSVDKEAVVSLVCLLDIIKSRLLLCLKD